MVEGLSSCQQVAMSKKKQSTDLSLCCSLPLRVDYLEIAMISLSLEAVEAVE